MSTRLNAQPSVGVVVVRKPWLIITNCSLTTAQQNAAKEAEEDLLLANSYFERIGRWQKIHEYTIQRHLHKANKYSLALINSTWDNLERAELQTPPPLYDEKFDTKVVIARGHASAFEEGSAEAEHVWAYNPSSTDNGSIALLGHIQGETVERLWNDLNKIKGHRQAAVLDQIEGHRQATMPYTVDEAELTLEQIQAVARRLRPESRCQHGLD
ncbi:hypothetical protein B0H16DRAFT_1462424 [Mycena metata]|uniref:Uncharacterized protein n=1 Tax=Mycena metata TaxID=1033252 RepID=A0AAD7N4X0_9AGAR|nr:hypothetical protein B0H16DRAFT_1462424 [Mycena metata]